ncbi:apolipoprotein N-acyltransferase [Rhizobium halophytocola]|uniref:Apolipoprotein N-acyltransferase n=1 Tax=Rhizobium halophytocola TaxID=735519 RepID=A0ABS4E044_9HYPH|nr:apolipoprotein N-acyltransferase [Rhizobium halophytocola]MBP1851306.1 apolipoprotein N-acyltransferase [Rhizobium halophytocola]
MYRLAGSIMLLWGVKRASLAIVMGALAALALPPFSFPATLFVSFTVLVWLLDGTTGSADGGILRSYRQAFVTGWLFGFGYFVAGLWWVGSALLVEADEFAWALPLAIVGLPALLAIFYGMATLIARIFWSEGFGRLAALALGFGLAEWLRSFVATGFPWNAIGYGAMPIPVMMQSAHAIGLFGVSALSVFVFATPALLGTRRGRVTGIVLATLLVVVHFGYGAWRLSEAPATAATEKTLSVRLVQPAVEQTDKNGDDDREQQFDDLLKLSALPPKAGDKRPDLIVWPETSVPFILTENPDAFTRIADTLQPGQVLLAGAVRAEDRGPGYPPRYYNSVFLINDKGEIIGASDKVHLTPFGEYVPFEDVLRQWGIDNLISLPGGFTAASARTMLTLPGGINLYPLICYEIIFPQEIDEAPASTNAIVNVTNDGWFGDTPGPYQHFLQARVRAAETGLPVIRDANNGISAVIDGKGQIVAGLSLDKKQAVDATISLLSVSKWNDSGRFYNFWLIIACLALAAVGSRAGFISALD